MRTLQLFLWFSAVLSALGVSLWDLHDAWTIWKVVDNPPPHVKLHNNDLRSARRNLHGALNRTALAFVFTLAGVVSLTAFSWLASWLLILGAWLVALLAWRAFNHRRWLRNYYKEKR